MAARMEVVQAARQIFHQRQVLLKDLGRKAGYLGVCRTGIERVGGVRQQNAESVVPGELQKAGDILLVNGFSLAAARVAGKELEGVGADGEGYLAHGFVPFCGGKMASDV